MGGVTVRLEAATDETIGAVERRLDANALPTGDVRANPERFSIAYVRDDPVGIGGVERYGPDGLLRSVVVDPDRRGEGVGTALCTALETSAATDGVRTFSLPTTTAAGSFTALGYPEIDREAAPDAIRSTAEFTDDCPASATCMRKSP